jgi:hypothetical protein
LTVKPRECSITLPLAHDADAMDEVGGHYFFSHRLCQMLDVAGVAFSPEISEYIAKEFKET